MKRCWDDMQARSAGRRARWLRATAMALLWLCAAQPAGAADLPPGPWRVTADRLEQFRDSDRYLAVGNVSIARGGIRLNADRVVFDRGTMTAEAEGHVIMTSGSDVMTGERLEMDLAAETGTLYQGRLFLAENHFYIRGDRLEKLGPDTYRGESVRLTTCDGEKPDWQIQGKHMEVTVEGYGKMDHATFRAGNLPLVYVPKLIFPAKRKRQTGLLPPSLGIGDRLGAAYGQPFFWAIDDHQDATVYLQHMSRRGEMLGLEYRYVRDEASRGTLMVDFLEDRKVDDGTDASDDWGFDDTPVRGNRDRYWLRGRIDQRLPAAFSAKLDVDLVSDVDYLYEFRGAINGFDFSDQVFAADFNRELEEPEDWVRTNRLNLNRLWSNYSLNLDTLWRDDVVSRQADRVSHLLQNPQSATFSGVRQPLGGTPLHFELESEWRYFYLEDRRRGQRLDIYPRVYWPLRFGSRMGLQPSVGLRETAWYVDHDDQAPDAQNDPESREMVDFRLEADSLLQRVYRPGRWGIDALQHVIQPRLVYDYVPAHGQAGYPLLEGEGGLDRIAETSRVSAVLAQTFTTRHQPNGATGDGEAPPAVYREIGYLELSQSYDRIPPLAENGRERRRHLSPLRLEVEFFPVGFFSLRADAERSLQSGHYDSHNVGINLADGRGDQLFLQHRYTYEVSESVFTQLLVPLSDNLTTYGEWERNLHDSRIIEFGAGLLYTRQCWALDFGYLYEHDGGKQFALMVHLNGLGGFGRDSVVARRIEDPFAYRRTIGDLRDASGQADTDD
ncbi:MAG: LPS assembly protein LptD [Desulfobacteraceae bacterium]|nr:LPS assembly protein LptD [Desulfobacteraceae bacterium]